MEAVIAILAYGVLWGAFHYWGFRKKKGQIQAHPERYSQRTVNFYCNPSPWLTAANSFLLALAVPLGVLIILVALHFLGVRR